MNKSTTFSLRRTIIYITFKIILILKLLGISEISF